MRNTLTFFFTYGALDIYLLYYARELCWIYPQCALLLYHIIGRYIKVSFDFIYFPSLEVTYFVYNMSRFPSVVRGINRFEEYETRYDDNDDDDDDDDNDDLFPPGYYESTVFYDST